MMRPNFALDLSTRGIALLQRSGEDDWQRVGDVAIDAPNLGEALAELRRLAETRAPEGLRSALIIPDDQIRYLDVPADPADGDHAGAAARALDGATPYALAELVWDWTLRGDTIRVAAVARETLDEAESFAREHGFNPVRFTARPGAAVFDGAPDFGATVQAGAGGAPASDAPSGATEPATSAPAAQEAADPPVARTRPAAPPRAGAPRPAPRLLPEADAREISGAARASLAPRETAGEPDAAPPAPSRGTGDPPRAKAPPAAPPPQPPAATKADEAERLTIFGARSEQGAGQDRARLRGIALISAALIAVVGVAGWAAFFPDSELGRLLRGSAPQVAVTPEVPEMESVDAASDAPEATAPPPGTTEPAPPPDARDSAALPATDAPAPPIGTSGGDRPLPIVSWTPPRTPEEERARYAETGIWPVAPEAPPEPGGGSLETFYQTSIDGDVGIGDAVALDIPSDRDGSAPPERPALPPPADQTFALDARGLVRATPEGALTPDGVRVFAGPPPVRQPDAPVRTVPLPGLSLTDEAAEALETLSDTRPRARPGTLVEEHERGALGGLTRTELAAMRPRERPAAADPGPAAIEAAAAAAAGAAGAAVAAATEEAIAESLKPRPRPEAVTRTARAAPATRAAPAPQIPTTASVARRATERNAINLRQVNLIGVYGTRADRRALVRLANGNYRRVQVGDRLDGGRVSAIGANELRYVKRGRNVVLKMPRG